MARTLDGIGKPSTRFISWWKAAFTITMTISLTFDLTSSGGGGVVAAGLLLNWNKKKKMTNPQHENMLMAIIRFRRWEAFVISIKPLGPWYESGRCTNPLSYHGLHYSCASASVLFCLLCMRLRPKRSIVCSDVHASGLSKKVYQICILLRCLFQVFSLSISSHIYAC